MERDKTSKMRNRKEREYEKICRECFNKYLSNEPYIKEIKWEVNNNDPPDYFYKINSKKYAVEVTSIDDLIPVGFRKLSKRTLQESQARLIREVEKEAIMKGIRSGTYHFGCIGEISKYKKFRSSIKKNLIKYISNTQTINSISQNRIFQKQGMECYIYKENNVQPLNIKLFQVFQKWEPIRDAFDQLQGAIRDKARKISKKSELPKILLILCKSLFVNGNDYKILIPKLESMEEFQIIFMCKNRNEGFFIHNEVFH